MPRSPGRFASLAERTLDRFAAAAYRRPGRVGLSLLACGLLAGVLTTRLRIDTDLARLLPESFRSVQDIEQVKERLGGMGYVAILARGAPPDDLRRLADQLAAELERLPWVRHVDYRRPLSFFRDRAHYFLDLEQLRELERQLEARLRWEKLRRNPYYVALEETAPPPVQPPTLQTAGVAARFAGERSNEPYYIDRRRQMIALLVKPAAMATDVGYARRIVEQVRGVVERLDRSRYHPDLRIDLTGRFAKRVEQQEQIEADLRLTLLLSSSLIILFLAIQLRRVVSVVLVLAPLMLGVLLSFGFAAVAVGSLNLLTALMGAILIGLGIDHGIHLVHRYGDAAQEMAEEQAVRTSLSQTGRAVAVAALTTVIAFAGLSHSRFRAFSEFGVIGSCGLALIVLSYLFALPPLIRLARRLGWRPADLTSPRQRQAARARLLRWAPLVFWGAALLVIVLSIDARGVRFDYDLGSLESKTLPSFALDQEVNRLVGHSQTPLVVLTRDEGEERAVIAELRRRRQARGAGSTIDFVLGSSALVPEQQREKHRVAGKLAELARQFGTLGRLKPAEQQRIDRVARMARVQPFGKQDLPQEVQRRFYDHKLGRLASFVLVFPAVRLNDGQAVRRLADEVRDLPLPGGRTVSAAAEAMITADMIELLIDEGPSVLTVVAMLVFVTLWLIVGNLWTALLSLLPALVTLAATMGLMPLVGLEFGYLNIVMLPVLFGIGVDGGAHMMSRIGAGEPFERVVAATGRPITAALLTTGLGFGALVAASQPGLRSVGELALLGLAVNLLACLVVLPALLGTHALRRQRREGSGVGAGWTYVSTLGGAGYIPFGGGTLGALLALPVAWALSGLSGGLRVGITVASVLVATFVVRRYLGGRNEDPPEVVIDEFVGCLIALMMVPWSAPWVAVALVTFRLLDIFKPGPIGTLDRRVHGAWGVMLDDVAAGLGAGLITLGLRWTISFALGG